MYLNKKNVLAKCKRLFEEKKEWDEFILFWSTLIKSPYELSFEEAWNSLAILYKDKVSLLDYLRATWLPLREKFVYTWTEKHLHFGNHVTSRAGGAHSLLKSYLQVSTSDFHKVKNRICLAIENQFKELKARLESEKVRLPHKFRIPLFSQLINNVSFNAFGMLFKQYELATIVGELNICTGHFQSSMGLPCAYKIRECTSGVLELVDVHQQWRIDNRILDMGNGKSWSQDKNIHRLIGKIYKRYPEMPLSQKEYTQKELSKLGVTPFTVIREPSKSFHKGRPSSSNKKKRDNSTKHSPSMFEIVEKVQKFSACNGVGHNIRTCPQTIEPNEESDNIILMEIVEP